MTEKQVQFLKRLYKNGKVCERRDDPDYIELESMGLCVRGSLLSGDAPSGYAYWIISPSGFLALRGKD